MTPVMTETEIMEMLDKEFPQIHAGGRVYAIDSVSPGKRSCAFPPTSCTCARGHSLRSFHDGACRPGRLRRDPGSYWTGCACRYHKSQHQLLRKPEAGDLLATCRLLKLGKRLAVVDCEIAGEGQEELVAHATATYSVPPR